MKVAVVQPSYIPWRGYFHQIAKCDTFVFYDDVQYDKHGWRNRNQIKTANGLTWLSIPVAAHGAVEEGLRICDVRIADDGRWAKKHWQSLQQAYARAPHFARYADELAPFWRSPPPLLAELTIPSTIALARLLGIERRFVRSSTLGLEGQKNDRLLQLLTRLGCTHYISGPSARDYLDEARFAAAGISVEWMRYDYREYPQLHPPFAGNVSALDLLFNVGPDALSYITG